MMGESRAAAIESKRHQEMAHRKLMFMLEFSLQVYYAKAVISKVNKVGRLLCRGCRHGYLSQRDHPCIMYDRSWKLEHYFWDVMGILDEEQLIENWYNLQTHTGLERGVWIYLFLNSNVKITGRS